MHNSNAMFSNLCRLTSSGRAFSEDDRLKEPGSKMLKALEPFLSAMNCIVWKRFNRARFYQILLIKQKIW